MDSSVIIDAGATRVSEHAVRVEEVAGQKVVPIATTPMLRRQNGHIGKPLSHSYDQFYPKPTACWFADYGVCVRTARAF